MKLIIISIDRNLLQESSTVRLRMERFGALVDGIEIILLGAGAEAEVILKNNVRVHAVSGNKLISTLKAVYRSRNYSTPETVIMTQDPFELGVIGWVASLISRRPLNVHVHIDFFSSYFRSESWRQNIQAKIAPFVLRRANSIRVVSKKIADYMVKELRIPVYKIIIAPIFVEARKLQNTPVTVDLHSSFPRFDFIVLIACRFVEQKNIPLAIEAFEQFRKNHQNAGLVIAGSGPLQNEIKGIVNAKGLESSIIVGAWVGDFASCMKSCDAFLLSSDYEGWGMTVIEAASLGKPIIMTDVGCAGEFLVHEKNGLVVPVRDPVAISNALTRYYSDRQFARDMGANANRDALSYMSKSENDGLLLASWQSAVDNHKK
ncbi:MAG: glycosyltransferase family 4 protein [Candidatus Taylorbacteria bacterium]